MDKSRVFDIRTQIKAEHGGEALGDFSHTALKSPPFPAVRFSYRPNFYRHIRAAAELDQFSLDMPGGRSAGEDYDFAASNRWYGYVLSIDHDVLVIPGQYSYVAFSAGYFWMNNPVSYNFKAGNDVPGAADGVLRITKPYPDRGYLFSARYVYLDSDEFNHLSISLEGQIYKSQEGTKKFTILVGFGFGKK
jgi:hypothetical protein